jgi:hypothetical protein
MATVSTMQTKSKPYTVAVCAGAYGPRGQPAGPLGSFEEPAQADAALPDLLLLAGQIRVQLGEDVDEILAGVVRQHVSHFVQAQPELGQSADAGQFDGVAQRVLAVSVGLARRLGPQPDAVVVPHCPGGDADGAGELSDARGTQ